MARYSDRAQARRELRVLIGRQRRRVDHRLHSAGREGRRLLSWRTYLRRYPAWALAAVGAGMTSAASLQRGRWPRQINATLFRRVGGMLLRRLMASVEAGTSVQPEHSAQSHDRGGEAGEA